MDGRVLAFFSDYPRILSVNININFVEEHVVEEDKSKHYQELKEEMSSLAHADGAADHVVEGAGHGEVVVPVVEHKPVPNIIEPISGNPYK